MNKKEINLIEILKDVPSGAKLYSPIFGDVTFGEISKYGEYRIRCYTNTDGIASFSSNGLYYSQYNGECMLFPSKENRNWNTYKYTSPKLELKLYDKVLVRDDDSQEWRPSFYWCYDNSGEQDMPYRITDGTYWAQCIPYEGNEYLAGTTDISKGGEQ